MMAIADGNAITTDMLSLQAGSYLVTTVTQSPPQSTAKKKSFTQFNDDDVSNDSCSKTNKKINYYSRYRQGIPYPMHKQSSCCGSCDSIHSTGDSMHRFKGTGYAKFLLSVYIHGRTPLNPT